MRFSSKRKINNTNNKSKKCYSHSAQPFLRTLVFLCWRFAVTFHHSQNTSIYYVHIYMCVCVFMGLYSTFIHCLFLLIRT